MTRTSSSPNPRARADWLKTRREFEDRRARAAARASELKAQERARAATRRAALVFPAHPTASPAARRARARYLSAVSASPELVDPRVYVESLERTFTVRVAQIVAAAFFLVFALLVAVFFLDSDLHPVTIVLLAGVAGLFGAVAGMYAGYAAGVLFAKTVTRPFTSALADATAYRDWATQVDRDSSATTARLNSLGITDV